MDGNNHFYTENDASRICMDKARVDVCYLLHETYPFKEFRERFKLKFGNNQLQIGGQEFQLHVSNPKGVYRLTCPIFLNGFEVAHKILFDNHGIDCSIFPGIRERDSNRIPVEVMLNSSLDFYPIFRELVPQELFNQLNVINQQVWNFLNSKSPEAKLEFTCYAIKSLEIASDKVASPGLEYARNKYVQRGFNSLLRESKAYEILPDGRQVTNEQLLELKKAGLVDEAAGVAYLQLRFMDTKGLKSDPFGKIYCKERTSRGYLNRFENSLSGNAELRKYFNGYASFVTANEFKAILHTAYNKWGNTLKHALGSIVLVDEVEVDSYLAEILESRHPWYSNWLIRRLVHENRTISTSKTYEYRSKIEPQKIRAMAKAVAGEPILLSPRRSIYVLNPRFKVAIRQAMLANPQPSGEVKTDVE